MTQSYLSWHLYKLSIRCFRKCLFATLIILSSGVYAQSEQQADEIFSVGNYLESIALYEKLLKTKPDNHLYNYRLGFSYLNSNINKKAAAKYFEKIVESGNYDKETLLLLAEAYTYHLDYDKALKTLQRFKNERGIKRKNRDKFRQMELNYRTAIEFIQNPVNAVFTNAGPEINTEFPEYYPFITKDGKNLIFTARRRSRPSENPEFDGYFPSDIYSAKWENNEFTRINTLSDRINTAYDEQGVGLSYGGDTIFIYVDHIEEYGDLYMSVKDNGVFRKVTKLGPEVNTAAVEFAATISKDGDRIIFSSNQSGGSGGFDLYEVKKLPDLSWSAPYNLGKQINTPLNEDFPTLSGDGNTLYFASQGHAGMGGYDIYFSTWDPNNYIWTEPQNLGYPINSPGDNKTISFTDDGSVAYISALRDDGYGDLDIYKITYPDKIDNLAIFTVTVAGVHNPEQIFQEIYIHDEYDELIGQYLPNERTGKYIFALKAGKYYVSMDPENHRPYNEVLLVNDYHVTQDINVKIIKLEE